MTEAFTDKLREVRDRSGLTLRELQQSVFVSDSALSRYLSGQTVPPWPVVVALCAAGATDPATLRADWLDARATRRGNRRESTTGQPDPHRRMNEQLAVIAEAAAVALRTSRDRGGPASEYLLALQRTAADATRLLRTGQPPATRAGAAQHVNRRVSP